LNTARENYGKDLTPSTQKGLERQITAAANQTLVKEYGKYKIEQNKLNKERVDALANANTSAEKEQINRDYENKKAKVETDFKKGLQEKANDLVKEAATTVVKAVETDKKTKDKNELEDNIRDHLRGFSRTIPSFLMAYGDENTTLENFDTIIPDNVFLETTSITLDQFRFLRDGGDYTDEETGETKHFEGHLFDPVVFNDSIQEFLRLKQKLSDYFDENQQEDIFDYIPPQKTNQIYTPKKVVIEMVDNLQKECPGCFDDPNKTFVDLYMKSGLYITEIVKRLFKSQGLKKAFPNEN
jgi:flagellin-like hook-associated protein FlgL